MASKNLQKSDLDFGRMVLLVTDSLDMSAEGAFWLLDESSDDEWRYFIVTSLLGPLEPRDMYLTLGEALSKKLSDQEAKKFEFYIISPSDELAMTVGSRVTTSPYSSQPVPAKFQIGAKDFSACVYRMSNQHDNNLITTKKRKFYSAVRKLEAA